MAIGGTKFKMGRDAAEVQQEVHRGLGAKAELDDDIENAPTRGLQVGTPRYPKARRYEIGIFVKIYTTVNKV